MPIYEYCCHACKQKFEKLARMNEEAPACPDCGSSTRKLMSLFRSSSSRGVGTDYPSGNGGCSSCSSSNCSSCG